MNRKLKQRQEEADEIIQTETVLPKFAANWSQFVRFDRIVLNISDCIYDVLPKVSKELRWKAKTDREDAEWDVWWTDWAVGPETLMKMEQYQKINHFPGMYTLSRKNLLAKNLMKMRKRVPDEYNYFPLTWTLPSDYLQLKSYHDSKPKGKARTYIVKPESLSQGKGIFLTRKLEDINPQQHCVVQRYLTKPYLIDNLKFDLRIYVLVAGVDPLRLYIFKEGLGRFATEEYVAPNRENIQDTCMHLTNYAINKESDKFVFNTDEKDTGIGHKRSLEAVFGRMKDKGVDVEALRNKIDDLIVKTMISGLSHLKFQYRSCQPDNYRGDMCFEILGFDVIISQDLSPMVLEINYTPSFSTDTPLDLNIKRNLIKDALLLVGVNKEFKESMVKERRECRQLRMRTGKKIKLTPEEKEEKRMLMQRVRDQHEVKHMGGFRKIFPVTGDRMAVYEQLIKTESEASGATIERRVIASTVDKLDMKVMQNRRKTEKLNKLPTIVPEVKDMGAKDMGAKVSQRKSQLMKTSSKLNDGEECLNEPIAEEFVKGKRELSVKIMRRPKVREVPAKKAVRERLVPKTIQFEANMLERWDRRQ